MSLTRTSPEFLTSKSHDVKIYPTEPFSDGRAFIEYDVLKRGLGDLDIEKCNPLGTVKSKIAEIDQIKQSSQTKSNRIKLPLDDLVRLAYRLSSFHPVFL